MNVLNLDSKAQRLMRELWRSPMISRSDLAERCGMDLSAVSRSMAGLVEGGYVEEREIGNAGPLGGRKPVKLRISSRFGIIVGIEIRSDYCDILFCDPQGEVVETMVHTYDSGPGTVEASIPALVGEIMDLAREKNWRVLGIAVGMPGIVNPVTGHLVRSNPLEITKPLPVAELLSRESGVPVMVDNDARCCCHAELPGDDFLYVLGEFRRNRLHDADFTGIALGLGLVLDGAVYRGADFSAGEFRSAFYDKRQGNSQFALPDADLSRLAYSPEVQVAFARELGRNLALLVNVLNLPKVIFGGALPDFGPEFISLVAREIKTNWQYEDQGTLSLSYASARNQAVAKGAVAMFLDSMYQA